MRFEEVVLFCLVSFANSLDTNPTTRFTLVEERSYNGAPSVSVEFSDGYKDTLILDKFFGNDYDRMENKEHCNYIGHLAIEHEACVAMTGCVGEGDVEFTILSTHAKESSLFKWNKDGNVEVIPNGFKNNLHDQRDVLEVPRDIVENGDEIINTELEAALLSAEENCVGDWLDMECTLPATQHLQIRVGYDDGIKNFLGGASETEEYIASVWTHLQVNYCHSSLGSKVLVERLPGIKHYEGMNLIYDPGAANVKTLYEPTANDLGDADLMLYMGFRGAEYHAGGGFARLGAVCGGSYKSRKQTKFSANFYGNSSSSVGESMAHEVGHNLGMEHDFDKKHGGNLNPCNGEGFMSYGNHKSQWSECSVKDFTALYTLLMKNGVYKWCLPAAPTACGGSSTTTQAPTTTSVPCKDTWNTTNCIKRKKKGHCSKTKMKNNCKKTCGAC